MNNFPPDYSDVDLSAIANASNFRFGTNEPYNISDFIAVYPQFGSYVEPEGGGDPVWTSPIPESVLQMYVNLASACLSQERWCELWRVAMSFFIAHFATLWLQTSVPANSSAKQIAQAGIARGIQVSKSVGPVSVSYQAVISDVNGFAAWKLTLFGQQLITHARIVGMGGAVIW